MNEGAGPLAAPGRRLGWLGWIVVVLALQEAGWMAFDGTRALIVGDYVTPDAGPYAGQLGPWSKLVEAAGIEPRSTFMKSFFAVYGAAWLLLIGAFTARPRQAHRAMVWAAAGALWFLPFGTICSVLQIVLLLAMRRRHAAADTTRP